MGETTRPPEAVRLPDPLPADGVVNVLLVEDNDDHAELFTDALERSTAARFAVRRVATSHEALATVKTAPFNAVLLDYQLGDVDGVTLLEQLRAAGSDTPVVLLTSHGSEDLAARALRARADDYMAKTEALLDETVARAVMRVMERRRLADQLARASAEAAAARARDAFLAAASHDLKNPLTVIRGTAQILQRRAERQAAVPREQLVAGLTSIERAATQMASQIEELLDVAHLRAGRALELERTPVDLVAIAREQVASYQQAADAHRLRLETAEGELIGQLDRARIGRVLANLLNNAVKYSPNGGEIVVRLVRECDAAGDRAVLTVSDQGMGISAADLPYIFEQFRRSENVVGHISGTGIGLAVVRQVVEQHGGTVVAASEPGKGSAFTIRLPLDPPAPAGFP
ncbi:MAG TPA: hybrid sensor histidine kinase/response regulator [Chloroflexota bacterium]|nr:hybrid sensor histidine kinase/response regulator [Chloroflexota bacterium]